MQRTLQRTKTPPVLKRVEEKHLIPNVCQGILNLPDQNSVRLVRWFAALLAVKAVAMMFVFILFGLVSGLEARTRMLQIGCMQLVSLLIGVYAIASFDRTALNITFLVEMYILSTATPLVDFAIGIIRRRNALISIGIANEANSNEAYIIAALFVFAAAMTGAWVTIQLREKLHEENKSTSKVRNCNEACASGTSAIKISLRVVAVLQMGISVALFALAILLHNSTWKQLLFLATSTFVCALVVFVNGQRSMTLTVAAFTYMIWDMSKLLPLSFEFLEAYEGYRMQCSMFANECGFLAKYKAVVGLLSVDTLVLLTLAVLVMSAANHAKSRQSSGRRVGGYRISEVMVALLLALSVFILLYGVVISIVAFTLNYTGLAKWFGFGILLQCTIAIYAIVGRDCGFLRVTYVITLWAVSAAWWWMSVTFEYVARADALCDFDGSHCESNLKSGVYLTAVYVMGGLVLALGSYLLSEMIEKDRKREAEAVNDKMLFSIIHADNRAHGSSAEDSSYDGGEKAYDSSASDHAPSAERTGSGEVSHSSFDDRVRSDATVLPSESTVLPSESTVTGLEDTTATTATEDTRDDASPVLGAGTADAMEAEETSPYAIPPPKKEEEDMFAPSPQQGAPLLGSDFSDTEPSF